MHVFGLLVEQGPTGIAAGEIGRRLGLPPATLSFHLRALTDAGLVSARQHGRSLYYSADPAVMHELIAYLAQNCCGASLASDDGRIAIALDRASISRSGRAPFAVPKPNIRPKNRGA
jgi:hypothetical protein